MNKAQARALLKEARAQVEDRARKEARMNGALLGFAPLRQAGTLFVYRALGAEPPTQALIEARLGQGTSPDTITLDAGGDGKPVLHLPERA